MLEKLVKKTKGFGVIELVVTTAIVGLFSSIVLTSVNPPRLINQAKDSRRKTDLNKIQVVLEDYYNDHNCYSTSIPFGLEWKEGNMTYLNPAPQDPNYPSAFYRYMTDGSKCPQWYVLFAKLLAHNSATPACSLPSDCVPINYYPSWDCIVTGRYNCPAIVAQALPANPPPAPGIITSLQSFFTGSTAPQSPTSSPTTIPTLPLATIAPGTSSPQLLSPTPTPSTVFGLPPATENSLFRQADDGSWCYDSDGTSTPTSVQTTGMYTQGFCIDKAGIHYDYCNNDIARDYYCTITSGSFGTRDAHCADGGYYCTDTNVNPSPVCVSGACTMASSPAPQSASQPPGSFTLSGSDGTYCYDSDGNGNSRVSGSCQDNSGIYYDFCLSNKTLVDYYCSGKWNGQAYYQVKCSGGTQACYGAFDPTTGNEVSCRSGVCGHFTP